MFKNFYFITANFSNNESIVIFVHCGFNYFHCFFHTLLVNIIKMFLFSIFLLALILVVGPKIGGARRWLVLGPIHFQPSELAKVTFILVTANFLGRSTEEGRGLLAALGSFLVMAVPMALVLREPDLGTSLVFLAVWVGMVFWYGFPGILLLGAASAVVSSVIMFYSETVAQQAWPWAVYLLLVLGILYVARLSIPSKVTLLAVNVGFGIGIPFFWDKLKGYQQERILTFFDPSRDEFGTGYQAIQSKVAIGSGGVFGTHYLKGTQKGLAFLPERHTDFIFSVIGEELGFLGAAAVLVLFMVILLRGVDHAASARRPFGRLLASSVISLSMWWSTWRSRRDCSRSPGCPCRLSVTAGRTLSSAPCCWDFC